MSFDAAACAAWLGASVTIAGVDTPLPVRLVKLLLVAFGDDMFAEADVDPRPAPAPPGGTHDPPPSDPRIRAETSATSAERRRTRPSLGQLNFAGEVGLSQHTLAFRTPRSPQLHKY